MMVFSGACPSTEGTRRILRASLIFAVLAVLYIASGAHSALRGHNHVEPAVEVSTRLIDLSFVVPGTTGWYQHDSAEK